MITKRLYPDKIQKCNGLKQTKYGRYRLQSPGDRNVFTENDRIQPNA